MDRSLLMTNKKKDRPWDGRSRISTQQYKDNYNEIFKKEKKISKNNSKPDDLPKERSLGTNLQISAEIVNGQCPHCKHDTVLVSNWTNHIYRCMTCGYDVRQKVNGKIIYLPQVTNSPTLRSTMKSDPPNG